MILRASMLTARRPSPSGLTPASNTQGRSGLSELMRNTTSPADSRVRLRLIFSNLDCCPLRRSSTTRLPLLRPTSLRSRPSRPSALTLSSQVRTAARLSMPPRRRGRRRRAEPGGRKIPERLRLGGRQHRGARQRTLVGRRKNRDVAILLDPHRELGAHQIEAFGARVAGQQAEAGESDLGARRARDHDPIAIAHHDIADAQAGAPILVALEHGAADLDAVAITEIFLDRRREPVGREIERDRAAREPVKQCPMTTATTATTAATATPRLRMRRPRKNSGKRSQSSQPGAAPETRQAARRRFPRRRTVVRQQALFQAA